MVKDLYLSDFTCFAKANLHFCKGINVFIGRNGTGKTHILKCLAASMKANAAFARSETKSKDKFGDLFTEKLRGYFKPDALGHLVNKSGTGAATVRISFPKTGTLEYSFGEKASLAKTDNNAYIEQPHFVYIPPREMLSLFDGFISLYEKREISFDETYLDLAKALDVAPLRNAALQEAHNMLSPVLAKWNIEVVRRGNQFYVMEHGKEYEAHLLAEGLRKVATIIYLCINGEITRGTTLLWDEPESNMNPALISVIVDLLIGLSKEYGVQMFLSTHDYLLSHKLSMMAEYATSDSPEMRFFSLYKKSGEDSVTVESAETLMGVSHNPILDEYSAFFDLENEFMSKIQ